MYGNLQLSIRLVSSRMTLYAEGRHHFIPPKCERNALEISEVNPKRLQVELYSSQHYCSALKQKCKKH